MLLFGARKTKPMKLTFVRNIQFTKLVKIDGRLKEFNFRKPNFNERSNFSVDTIDQYGERIIFQMKHTDATWKIITDGLPRWILDQEANFNEIIKAEIG